MKFSTTLVFLFLFILVGGVYLYLQPKPGEAPHDAPVASSGAAESLIANNQDSITWLQIQNMEKKEAATFILQDKIWVMKYPVRYAVMPESMDEMIKALNSTVKIRKIMPEKDLDNYGLQLPSMKIGIETTQHPERRYLALGTASPTGNVLYARWENEKEIFLVGKEFKAIFDRSVYGMREKRIFRLPVATITKMEFQIGPETYQVEKREGKWSWKKPVSILDLPLDGGLAQNFLSMIGDLFIKDFLDQAKEKNDASFFKAERIIRVWGKDSDPQIFYVGQEAPRRDAFYAKREGEDALLLIDRGAINSLFEMIKTMTTRRLTTDVLQ